MNINLKKNSFSFLNTTVSLYIVTLFTVASNSELYILNRISFFIMLLAFILKVTRKSFSLGRGVKYTFPFYCVVVLSNLWAFDIATSLHRTIGLSFYYFGGLIVYLLLHNNFINVKTIKISSFISLCILTITASYEYYIMDLIRASGLTDNANTFGLNIVFLGLIYLYLIKNKGIYNIIVKLFTFAIIFNAMIISGSRKVVIALVIIMVYYLLKNYLIKISNIKIAVSAILLAVIIIIVKTNSHYLMDFINSIYGFERLIIRDDGSFDTRGNMIVSAIEFFKERPILGYGIDNFRVISSYGTYSHNNFTELLVSLGLVGLIIYYLIYLSLIKLSFLVYQRVRNVEVFLFTLFYVILLVVQEFALVTINSPRNWILLFLLYWINEKALKDNTKNEVGNYV